LNGIADEAARAKRIERGAVTMERFTQAVAETSAEFYQNLLTTLTDSLEQFGKLGTVLDEKCGANAPPASSIRSALESCVEAVKSTAGHKLKSDEPAPGEGDAAATGSAGGAVASKPPGEVQSREEAFTALMKIADFFRRTEPHSPISYALEQVVRWGRLPLPQLLLELVPDRGPREYLTKLIGLPPEQS